MAELSDEIGPLLSRAAQRWQLQANRSLQPTGLTYGQVQLLSALAAAPGGSQAEVARAAGMDAMTASGVLRRLERRRLIVRRASDTDSRARRLTLTQFGVDTLVQARELIAAAEAAFFAGVGAQRPELAGVLGALLGQRRRVRVAMGRNAAAG